MNRIIPIFIILFTINSFAAEKEIINSLKSFLPNISSENINKTPIDGLYEVMINSRIMYVSSDGKYFIQGDIYDLNNKINITKNRKTKTNLKILQTIKDEYKIIFKAKNEKYAVDIFTDIDCPYCRKLHMGMQEMNDLGITVKYLAFPRAGVGSDSYDKTVSVWCAKDKKAAMTASKSGLKVEYNICKNPVEQHMSLVHKLGVTGTPSMFLANGVNIPGYLPPKNLLAEIKKALN